MTAKEYLKQYENIVRRIRILDDRIQVLEEEADMIKSVTDYDGMPHGSNIGHPTEDKAIRLVDEKLRRTDLRLAAQEQAEVILDTILKVDGVEQEVLYLRYIKLMKWEEIACAINYSWEQTHFYHRKALSIVESLITT